MTSRRNLKGASESVPGPGAYKLSDSIGSGHAPSYTLRPKTNIPADLADAPGPGAYNPDTSKGKGPRISMAPKLDLKGLTDAVPGPGTYTSPYEVGKEAPKYSMTGRGAGSNEGLRSPGPGAYTVDPSYGKPKLAASMKSRHYDKPDAFQPGPGAYKLADSIGGSSNAPSYTMRPKTQPKNSAGPIAVPGPGQWQHNSSAARNARTPRVLAATIHMQAEIRIYRSRTE